MRKLLSDHQGNVTTIILAVATAITIAISILIIYSILGGMNTTAIDKNIRQNVYNNKNASRTSMQPAGNATTSLTAGLATFFTISPIYLVVLVAVAIIGAVMGMMYFKKD